VSVSFETHLASFLVVLLYTSWGVGQLVVPSGSKPLVSFKRFKTGFFKVVIRSAGAEYFYFDNGEPKFPFFWTKNPTPYRIWPRTSLTQEDLYVLSYLDQLPKKLSSKKIIGVFRSFHPRDDLFGMYVHLTTHRYVWYVLTNAYFYLQISWLLLVPLVKKCSWN